MLLGAFICLIIAICAAGILFTSEAPTTIVLTKIVLHLFAFFALVFLCMALFNSTPNPTPSKPLLPI
jgi:hypothetical protein